MNDKNHLELGFIWGAAATFCTTSVGYIGSLFFRNTSIDSNRPKHYSTSDKTSEIDQTMQALSEINQLFDKIDEDKSLINETLENFNAELAGLIKNDQEDWERKCVRLKRKLKKHHIFKEPEEIIILRREKINTTELLHTLAELMDSYPKTTLYMTSTLDEIKDFYRDLKEHHEKVVSIAETLFPNFFRFLNQSKKIEQDLNQKESKFILGQ